MITLKTGQQWTGGFEPQSGPSTQHALGPGSEAYWFHSRTPSFRCVAFAGSFTTGSAPAVSAA